MIPIHATATTNPRQLRWVVPPDNLPPGGIVRQAPGRLGAWLNSGLIAELVVRTHDVLITLGAEYSWRDLGDEMRDALGEALSNPAAWSVDKAGDASAGLAEVVTELLAGEIGTLARSHGGSIELVSVTGSNVAVRMSGACDGCPATSSTLHDKLLRKLRQRVGEEVTVSYESGSSPLSFGKKLLSLLVR